MTDGRANVCRDGRAGRARAMEDALDAGRRLNAAGVRGAGDRHVSAPSVATRRRRRRRIARGDARAICAAACRRRRAGQRGGPRRIVALGRGPVLAVSSRERLGVRPRRRRLAEQRGQRFRRSGRLPLARPADGRRAPSFSCSMAPGRPPTPGRRSRPCWRGAFSVVAPDLPGHGFTTRKKAPDLSLPGMARSVAALLSALDFRARGRRSGIRPARPSSPGFASIGTIAPKLFVSLNGAFLPFEGAARFLFPSMAQTAVSQSAGAAAVRLVGRQCAVANLLRGTGLEDRAARRRALRAPARAIPTMSRARSG